ncbi:hypothetical protein POM88_040512 [Heracleum sosnowskyi]|uniref:Reverse transcriptase zinc-binding domain-containing protein n=1 Tax=Heracleum sosnowskyi TaxID=360622 RepID=A0AAD8M8W2_9APIA|nr:hypothetical protein POM88_040512 [Heracleum sosnowskyi]
MGNRPSVVEPLIDQDNPTDLICVEPVMGEAFIPRNSDFVENMVVGPYKIGELMGCDVVMDEDQILTEILNINEDNLVEFDSVPPTNLQDSLDDNASDDADLQGRKRKMANPGSITVNGSIPDPTSSPIHPVVIALATASSLPPMPPAKSNKSQLTDEDGFTKTPKFLDNAGIGDGGSISLWFDPWWRNLCLASSSLNNIISQAFSHPNAMLNQLIHSGTWQLPTFNSRLHYINPRLMDWTTNFDSPTFNLNTRDCILWDGVSLHKVRTRHIWDSIRFKLPEVSWHKFVWHKLHISRYAHDMWLACHGRLNTFHRVASFGINIPQHCLLCAGGIETLDHLLVSCPFSSFILHRFTSMVHNSSNADFSTWLGLLNAWGGIDNALHKYLLLLLAQVFCYHIWKERNARFHNNGCRGLHNLLEGIVTDVKLKLCNSTFFVNLVARYDCCNRWLD